MNREEFVKSIKENVRDLSITGMIKNLADPPGRKPDQEMLKISQWYNGLNKLDKEMLFIVIKRAIDQSVFGFFAVIDGVRAIENNLVKGKLELYYNKESVELLLNNELDEYLHDIYKNLISNLDK